MATGVRRRWGRYCVGAVAVTALGVVWAVTIWVGHRSYSPPPFTFEGDSDQLKETVVVPTLDSPLPAGKSAVWCVSFQLAWNHLRDDVVRGPIRLANAQPIADRLNVAAHAEDDLAPDAVFAAAGLGKDGIVDRIHTQMAKKFPAAPRPTLHATPAGAVAYAYLTASSKFDIPFFDDDEPLPFTDAAGRTTPVAAFGIRQKDEYAYHQLRHQVEILYGGKEVMAKGAEAEFVLDPCKTSRPYQVVVARVARRTTLAETLADVEAKAANQADADSFYRQVLPLDTVLVPTLAWSITHRFTELEGLDKRFENPGLRNYHLDTAIQTIRFRLDRSGAELASEAKMYIKPMPADYHVNRPFLVYMKKRDGGRPFFVAWVETAELLATNGKQR
jgi:hypothetical protein